MPEPEAAAWLRGLPKALWQLGAGRAAASAAALALLHDAARFGPRAGPVAGALGALQPQLAVLFTAPAPGAAGGQGPEASVRSDHGSPEARGKRGSAATGDAPPGKRRKKGKGKPASAGQPPDVPASHERPASAGAGAPAVAATAGLRSIAAAGGDAASVRGGAMVPGPLSRLPTACQVRTASPTGKCGPACASLVVTAECISRTAHPPPGPQFQAWFALFGVFHYFSGCLATL